MQSPYTPSFGVSPPLLVGRGDEIGSFRDSMADGPGSPGRALLPASISDLLDDDVLTFLRRAERFTLGPRGAGRRNYVSQYRLRLIDAEVIEATGWGRVDFTLPYLRDHVAREPFDS